MSQPESNDRLFHLTRVILSLISGLLIAWIIGSATWNVHWLPGVPVLKGIILLVIGILGYNIMDRRIMGLDKSKEI